MHAGDPFVIPNPWDVGSARVLEALGFAALATTSSGFAFTLGVVDGRVSLDQVAQHVAAIDAATDLPVSADLEDGFGPDPEDAAEAIRRIAEAGAVGDSIEDFDRESRELYEIGHAVERIRAAAEAAHGVAFPFMLTARAENHIRENPDLADTIRRLRSYEEAGADVLYAPGLGTIEEIRAVCDAVSKPVNVLAVPGLSVAEIVEAGAQRISVGGSLTCRQGVRRGGRRDPRPRGCLSPLRAGSAGRLVRRSIGVPGSLAGTSGVMRGRRDLLLTSRRERDQRPGDHGLAPRPAT